MLKNLLILFGLTLAQQAVKAAKADTLLFCMKYTDELANNRADADYYRLVTSPDSSVDKSLYQVKEYYLNLMPKMFGTSLNRALRLKLQGLCTTYYHNGKQQNIANYNNGEISGDVITYYQNGKIYSIVNFGADKMIRRIECRDSTGKVLTMHGNGQWIDMDDSCKTVLGEGAVKDSLNEGEWHGLDGARIACVNLFKAGHFISGVYYDTAGGLHKYADYQVEPPWNMPISLFDFFQRNMRYPSDAKRENIQGRVILTFAIEKDGSITNIKVLRTPRDDFSKEAIRVLKLTSWLPGIQNGHPVRTQFTLPISFDLYNN